MTPNSPDTVVEPADRRTGLVLFGILDVIVGLLYLVKTLAIFMIAVTGAKPRLRGVDIASELPVAALLALLPALFFLSIGIGSCVGRRWARSVSEAFAWVWLGFGSVTAVAILFCLPRLAAAAKDKPPFLAYAIIEFFGIVLPGAYLVFYRSAPVKAYCEWLDPEERWTDRCPVAILTVMFLLLVGANLALGIGYSTSRQVLFFGHALDGNVRLGFAAAAAFEVLVAWRLYRREVWAWVAAVVVMIARGAASVAIASTFTIERLTKLATQTSSSRLSPKDAAALESLKNLHPTAAITTYIVVLALLELSFVIWAGRWVKGESSEQARPTG